MARYKAKTEGDFDWEFNKTVALATANTICSRLRDAVLIDLDAKMDAADKQGDRYVVEKPLSPSEVLQIVLNRVGHMIELEAAGDAEAADADTPEIEDSKSE